MWLTPQEGCHLSHNSKDSTYLLVPDSTLNVKRVHIFFCLLPLHFKINDCGWCRTMYTGAKAHLPVMWHSEGGSISMGKLIIVPEV